MTSAMPNVMQNMPRRSAALAVAAVTALLFSVLPAAAETASQWAEGFNNKARLLAGTAKLRDEAARPYAGLEIQMPKGWKTYWRAPGDAGGIPPELDFSGSENLAKATVLFPAPKKLIDRTGTTYGYKDQVTFPIRIEPSDAASPVVLKVKASYGVCEELCVPAEVELEVTIAPGIEASDALAEALAHVPATKPVQGTDPIVDKTERLTASGKPVLRITASDKDASQLEAFVDSPDGIFLPVPKKLSADGGKAVFDLDLSDGVDMKDLQDKTIAITLTSATSQSETTIRLPAEAAH